MTAFERLLKKLEDANLWNGATNDIGEAKREIEKLQNAARQVYLDHVCQDYVSDEDLEDLRIALGEPTEEEAKAERDEEISRQIEDMANKAEDDDKLDAFIDSIDIQHKD